MKLNFDAISLVVAGAWNPYVLQPIWVLSRMPGAQERQDHQLTTEFGIGGIVGGVEDTPKFTFPGLLRYQIRTTSLILSPTALGKERMDFVQQTAHNILRELRHTPVSGVGYNFEYLADDPAPSLDQLRIAQEDVVAAVPGEANVVSNIIRTSLQRENVLINVSKEYLDGKLSLKFNFHLPATSTEFAAQVIERYTMWTAHQEALEIAKTVLGEEITEDE